MKPGHSRPFTRFRVVCSDAKHASYTLWFTCKHLTRKFKRAIGISKAGGVRLPQEIVDCIVDYISEDRPTLFACTRLSRAWCIAARAHLYRTFTVSYCARFEAAIDLQRMGIIHLVRRIDITRGFLQPDFFVPEMMSHLNAFTHLQVLDIKYLNVGEMLVWLHLHRDILKPTIRTLTLRYPRGSIKQLLCFISLFSGLENLAVEHAGDEPAFDPVVPVLESSSPFTGQLTLTGIFDQEFMSGLASFQKGLNFRKVDLQCCGGAQEVIDSCAGTMEQLTWYPSDFHCIESLDLSRCDSLRHVEVSSYSITRAFPDHPFRDFISIISPPRLKTCLIMSYNNDLDELVRILLAVPEPDGKSTSEEEEKKTKRDVNITFGLDIENDPEEYCRVALTTALGCAIGNGVFEFLTNIPVLKVYPRMWNPTT